MVGSAVLTTEMSEDDEDLGRERHGEERPGASFRDVEGAGVAVVDGWGGTPNSPWVGADQGRWFVRGVEDRNALTTAVIAVADAAAPSPSSSRPACEAEATTWVLLLDSSASQRCSSGHPAVERFLSLGPSRGAVCRPVDGLCSTAQIRGVSSERLVHRAETFARAVKHGSRERDQDAGECFRLL